MLLRRYHKKAVEQPKTKEAAAPKPRKRPPKKVDDANDDA